jgi:hypothetical protein
VASNTALTFFKACVAAAVIAILYRYWLIAPVLHYLTINQWRLAAIGVAVTCGFTFSLFKIPMPALPAASLAGLLIGGTFAAWRAPHDIPMSAITAINSHLQSFWREVALLTGVITLSAWCVTRLTKRSRPR